MNLYNWYLNNNTLDKIQKMLDKIPKPVFIMSIYEHEVYIENLDIY